MLQQESVDIEEQKAAINTLSQGPYFSRSIEQDRRKANMGGVMTYGEVGGISEDKAADINQLKDEVDQIRSIMNQIRRSGESMESV